MVEMRFQIYAGESQINAASQIQSESNKNFWLTVFPIIKKDPKENIKF